VSRRARARGRRLGRALGAAGLALLALLALGASSCSDTLAAGDWGTLRFLGRVKGKPPLAVLPPVSDRSGNLYTLYGALGLPEVSAFVAHAAGGSVQPCALTKGDVFGAHGWVGFADDRAWYWSGEWLVVVPAYYGCEPVLRVDPHTDVELQFRAVMPWVRVTPSRSSLVALIQTASDRVPFSALVDLTRGVTTNVAELPFTADAVAVLGVGADPASGTGVALVSLTRGGATTMQALFYDDGANLLSTAPVSGAPPPEYGVVGNLEFGPGGKVVGLTSLGSLVVFDRDGGAVVSPGTALEPVGVHRWGGALWLVGTAGGRPVVAPIDDAGRPGAPTSFKASERAAEQLAGAREVTDDREFPARTVVWPAVTSAIGARPFLSAHSPWPHAPGTTLWAVAGPQVEGNGRTTTSIAVAPVGLAYP
jgi:hypothetical protein